MKRLTERLEDGQAIMDCTGCPESWNTNPVGKCTALYCRNMLKDRLAAIEDILCDGTDEYDLDRLRELAEADREGRCVVLPCKRDDILWTFQTYPSEPVYSFHVTDPRRLTGGQCSTQT